MANFELTEEQLQNAVHSRRFKEDTVNIARMVMVDKLEMKDILASTNLTRSRIYQLRDQVWAAHLEASLYPSDWVMVSIKASPVMAKKFIEAAEKERKSWLRRNEK